MSPIATMTKSSRSTNLTPEQQKAILTSMITQTLVEPMDLSFFNMQAELFAPFGAAQKKQYTETEMALELATQRIAEQDAFMHLMAAYLAYYANKAEKSSRGNSYG